MLELLILYALKKQENTLYGLRQLIATQYGEVSIPSHGALFPALKRLENKKLISVRKKLSDGGKRYTYYSISGGVSDFFNEKFMEFNNAKSETPENFLIWLKTRLIVLDMADESLLGEFKEKCLLKINKYNEAISDKLSDKYIELTKIQRNIIEQYKKELDEYSNLLNTI